MRHIPHSCAVGQKYIYLPVAGGGSGLTPKLNVAVGCLLPGVETGDRVAGIFHTGRRSGGSAVFQRAGNPQGAVMLGDNSARQHAGVKERINVADGEHPVVMMRKIACC